MIYRHKEGERGERERYQPFKYDPKMDRRELEKEKKRERVTLKLVKRVSERGLVREGELEGESPGKG